MTTTLQMNGKKLQLQADQTIQQVEVDCKPFAMKQWQQDQFYFYPHQDSKEIWPARTGFPCMNCCHLFDTNPIPIVHAFNQNKFYVSGSYCSVNCAKYVLLHSDVSMSSVRIDGFNRMVMEVFKIYDPVFPSPPPMMLKLFGGSLTIEEFRSNFATKDVETISWPLVNTTILRDRAHVPLNSNSCTILPENKLSSSSNSEVSMYEKFLSGHSSTQETHVTEKKPERKRKPAAQLTSTGLDSFLRVSKN